MDPIIDQPKEKNETKNVVGDNISQDQFDFKFKGNINLFFKEKEASITSNKFKYKLTNEKGIPPAKNNSSDAGYDLHLVELKEVKNGLYYYDTGVAIQLPVGYFGMLVGRSSIAKTGYMLANSVGIIDNEYRGSIMVVLRKVDPMTVKDLILPMKLAQLIPIKQIDFQLLQCDELDETVRGDKGGLGSGQFSKKD